jgi:hypothetical protein
MAAITLPAKNAIMNGVGFASVNTTFQVDIMKVFSSVLGASSDPQILAR